MQVSEFCWVFVNVAGFCAFADQRSHRTAQHWCRRLSTCSQAKCLYLAIALIQCQLGVINTLSCDYQVISTLLSCIQDCFSIFAGESDWCSVHGQTFCISCSILIWNTLNCVWSSSKISAICSRVRCMHAGVRNMQLHKKYGMTTYTYCTSSAPHFNGEDHFKFRKKNYFSLKLHNYVGTRLVDGA